MWYHLFSSVLYTMAQCLPWKEIFSQKVTVRHIFSNLVNVLIIQNREGRQNLEELMNFSQWDRLSYIYNPWIFFDCLHRDWRLLIPCNLILQGIAIWGRKAVFSCFSKSVYFTYGGRNKYEGPPAPNTLLCVLISLGSPMECTNTHTRNTKSVKYRYKIKKHWSYLPSLQSWQDWETSQCFIAPAPGQKIARSYIGVAKNGETETRLSQEEISAGLLSWIKQKGAQFSIPLSKCWLSFWQISKKGKRIKTHTSFLQVKEISLILWW